MAAGSWSWVLVGTIFKYRDSIGGSNFIKLQSLNNNSSQPPLSHTVWLILNDINLWGSKLTLYLCKHHRLSYIVSQHVVYKASIFVCPMNVEHRIGSPSYIDLNIMVFFNIFQQFWISVATNVLISYLILNIGLLVVDLDLG